MPGRILQLYRNSFSGLNRNTWLLALVQLVNRAGTMVVPFMSMYMTQKMGVSITKAGFVLACFGMGSIVGSFAGGKLTDRFGFYYIMIITLLLGGLSFIGLSFLTSYWWICAGTFVMAIVNEAFRPASMAAISAYSNAESITRSGSLVRLSVNLGWAVGAAVGGWIAAHNYSLLFWVDGCTNMAAALVVLYALPKINYHKKPSPSGDAEVKNYSPFRDVFFLFFVFLNCFFGICFFQLFTTLPVYLKTSLLLDEARIGWIMGINGLLIAFFEMIIVYSLENVNKLRLISWGTFVTGLSFVVYNLFTGMDAFALAMMAVIIITVGEILAMPFMLSFTMKRSTPATIGQYASLYTMSYSVAHICGSYSGSAIADRFGFDVLWWCVGAISVLISVCFLYMQKKEAQYPPGHFA